MAGLDKNDIKDQLTTEDVFELLDEFGGEPRYTNFGIISRTICHNPKGEGSFKLYYYENSQMFHCFTGCNDSFDAFELVIKVNSWRFVGIIFVLKGEILYFCRKNTI